VYFYSGHSCLNTRQGVAHPRENSTSTT
jgi:hypothetical protein